MKACLVFVDKGALRGQDIIVIFGCLSFLPQFPFQKQLPENIIWKLRCSFLARGISGQLNCFALRLEKTLASPELAYIWGDGRCVSKSVMGQRSLIIPKVRVGLQDQKV